MTERDPLAPELRASRLASWGPVPDRAAHLAGRLTDRFRVVTGIQPEPAMRPFIAAQQAPPSVRASRLEPGAIDALARGEHAAPPAAELRRETEGGRETFGAYHKGWR